MSEAVFLPDSIFAEAEAVGLRLRACVREAIERSLGSVPTARDLANTTGIDGVISKRLIKLLRDGPGAAVLTHAPSVVNLRDFARVLEAKHDLGPLEAFALRDAASKFEKLIQAFGGSKGELTKALRSAEDSPTPAPAPSNLEFGALTDRVIHTEQGEPFAALTDLNPLALEPDQFAEALIGAAIGGRVITWSGTTATDLFARDPSVWSGEGMEALGRLCRAVAPKLKAAGVRWLLRPHCRHALCDTQRTVSFLRTQVSSSALRESIGIALDPVAMLESSMLSASSGGGATPADFIGRAIRTLGPVCEVLLISGAQPPEQSDSDDFEHAPLPQRCSVTDGLIDPGEQFAAMRTVAPFLGRIVPLVGDAAPQIAASRAALSPDDTA
ncbi:MAG: hypothetical protein ACIAQF_03070 [Phycisphaerales bacterium JB065]